MPILATAYDKLVRWRYGRIADYLTRIDPAEIRREGEKRTLQAFQRAATSVPAYRGLLARSNVPPGQITSIKDFCERVPIVDKDTLFQAHSLRDVCTGANLDDIRLFYSSSGSTGVFSFGIETWQDAKRAGLELEFILDDFIGIFEKRTLIINCLPMGVKIHTRTLPVIESGLRFDVIWVLLKKLRSEFEQFVLIGEQLVLKRLIEDGAKENVPWKDLVIHVVTGAEYVAENFRTYLGALLGIDFDDRRTGSITINFGLSEVTNSIGRETPETQSIRRIAHADPEFRKKLYGDDARFCASLLQYHPYQNFIETAGGPGRGEMIVTTLDLQRKLPLIRYNTKDTVDILPYEQLHSILAGLGKAHLMPRFRLPFLRVWGKYKALETAGGGRVYPEEVKEALYADHDVAAKVTGSFRLQRVADGAKALIQLRPGESADVSTSKGLEERLLDLSGCAVTFELLPYQDYPYGFEQNFERKAVYL